jgi:hypothetical protein
MTADEVADELYGISPDEFIERRTERVAQARQAGDRALAKQISQLRRPTRTAWMVNLLVRANEKEIEKLLDLGHAMEDAQQRAAGDDLRQLSRQRRTTVDSLTRRAIDLAETAGYTPTETTIQEVSQTLQAALSAPEIAELVRLGRLTQAASYGGFGPAGQPSDSSSDLLAALAASAGATKDRPPQDHVGDGGGEEREAKTNAELLAAERELDEATRDWEEAVRAASEAAEAADAATTRAEELADKIDELRAELRQAEGAERDARAEARQARKHAQQLRQAAATAEQRRTALRDKLADQRS